MSDEESHRESEFYYPKEEEQAKTKPNNMSKLKLPLTETKISVTVNTVRKRQVIWSTVFLSFS